MIPNPFWLLIPLAGIIFIILITIMTAKPLALLAYLRAIQAAQEPYHKLYKPFVLLPEPEQDGHHLILGAAGAGKTMLSRIYQYAAVQNRRSIVQGRSKIPVYVPLKQYSLFLKMRQQIAPADDVADDTWEQPSGPGDLARNVTLIDFLCGSDLPGMRHLRRYLKKLVVQGRIVFLCDGLNEVDHHYLGTVSAELEYLLRWSRNRLIVTSRTVDYRAQPRLTRLVTDGQLICAELQPLQPEQVREFVERYIAEQGEQWRHTAGQIMEVINRSRLRYHCTNPMMLSTLMQIIDATGVQRGKQIDTRGQLLRAYVSQLIERERRQARWGGEAPAESTVLAFLGELACAARLADDRNAIKLRVSPAKGKATEAPHSEELAGAVQMWLDEHPPQGPFATGAEGGSQGAEGGGQGAGKLTPLLMQFAQSVGLIDVSADGVLSFGHELIATYLVAAYFSMTDSGQQSAFRSMPTAEIKDGLIEHLLADKLEHISMALGLLLERISDEATLPRADQEMVRALLEHVQTQSEERATQRIIALLLLIGGSDVANQIAWGLYHYHDQPGHQEQLTRAFLLLGKEAQEVLVEMLRYRTTSAKLLAEVVSVLGMMTPHQDVYECAKAIGTPGLSIYQASMTYAERQAVALRALGGLLAGGHLNSSTLQSRQTSSLYGSPEHELYSVLLGKPYGPLITKLENDSPHIHQATPHLFQVARKVVCHEILNEPFQRLIAESGMVAR